MALYYLEYIPNLSRIIAPLVKLTKGDALYEWSKPQNRGFEKVKELLAWEPILTLPKLGDPYLLTLDFSYDGMGLVFS